MQETKILMKSVAVVIFGSVLIFSLALQAQQQSTPQVAQSSAPTSDLKTIAGDKNLWPPYVVLKAPVAIPIIINGKQVGSVTAPIGTSVQVVSVNADGVLSISQNGNQAKISADKTNFTEAAAQQQSKLAELKTMQEARAKQEAKQQEIHNQEVAKAKEAEELWANTKKVHIVVIQSISGGVLASLVGYDQYVYSSTPEPTIFVQGVPETAEGKNLQFWAYKDGLFHYKDISGAERTIEKWVMNTTEKPNSKSTTKKYVSPLGR